MDIRSGGRKREPGRPNVLLAIADDWGTGHAGAYGCRWVKTPSFDRVAREGVLFRNAYTPNAKCAPSRACLLTGRNPWQLKEAANHWCHFPAEFKTYAEALAEHGYFVGKTGKGWAPGVAKDAQGRPRAMAGRAFDKRTATPPTPEIGRNDYAANFEAFLDAAPGGGAPWCFWYGCLEPHRAYEYGSGAAKGGKRPADVDRVPACWPDNEVVRNDLLDYAFEVEHFDRHLGRMLESLERRGLLEETVVIVTSDNGMPFPRAKGQGYDASNHLPLAIRWGSGGGRPGRVVDDFVSFIDVAPTLIELAGLRWEQTGMAPAAGRSLAEILRSAKDGRVDPERDHVLIGKERHDVGRPGDVGYPIRGIVRGGLLYLHNFATDRWPVGNPEAGYPNCDGSPTKTEILNARRRDPGDRHWALCFGKRPAEELYDLAADPDCLTNLASDPARRADRDRLRAQLFDALKAQQDPRVAGRGDVFDAYPYADESGRHFYERVRRGEKVKAGWITPTDFEKAPLE